MSQKTTDQHTLYPPAPTGAYAGLAGKVARQVCDRAAAMCGITVGEREDADLVLHRPGDFYARLGVQGLVGFGESYVAGDWDAADLAGTLTKLCREITGLLPPWLQKLGGLYTSRRPLRQKNTVAGANSRCTLHGAGHRSPQ
ncbi:hypothetical protein [Corynebacterium variabile]|uniref:Cyclopropane-fatty-acyl-phospholipid synthase n=1 Tax=Corynebacterium variabile TaxID=1727 RepID=A0A0X2NMA0_9CORY|nr:hypothetical protein [Corynebacterium variabile]CUU66613.1 hypothetical protein CVAR292_01960 [Corynebacterium variabile]